jgi:hypothetical protein
MKTALVISLALGLGAIEFHAALGPEGKDSHKIARDEEWNWVPERASAKFSAQNFKGDFEAKVVEKEGSKSVTVRFFKGDDVVFAFEGHKETVFFGRDNIVYYSEFSQTASGCTIIAYDLKAKKQLWKSSLKALGPISRTHYRNQVILDIKDDAVHILGSETAGKYVEYLDLKKGELLGQMIFELSGGKGE